MNYITTFTGKHFDPTAPDMEKVDIRDIAHALSMTCRGNGHVKTFFSVGQHCILCAREAEARGCDRRIILACLLHDASEAYMSDVPRPFKQSLPMYRKAEEALLSQIYEKYLGSDLSDAERELVRQIDDDLLYFDLKYLLNENPKRAKPQLAIEVSHAVKPFAEVERDYLLLYEKYAGGEV